MHVRKDTVTSEPAQKSVSNPFTLLVFAVLSVISLAVWWRPLTSTLALALRDDQYTHILLILPVSAVLIFLDWKSPEPLAKTSLWIGLILLLASVILKICVGFRIFVLPSDKQLSLNMLALVLWWIGTFILCFGPRAFRRALFPLGFLFWIVPIPEFLLGPMVKLLQQGSAESARLLFAAIGLPVAQEGTRITIPGLTVEVARECSSIRSSLMLVVTTMVLAQVLLRSNWRKALVIAVAIPLSVAKNGLRIFVLAMLGTRVDASFLTGRLHHQGGVIYFLIALSFLGMLVWFARRSEERRAHPITNP